MESEKVPQEFSLSTLPPEKKEINSFPYFSLGALGWMNHFPIAPDLSFGRRKLDSHHVWDMNLGANPFVIYGQVSYLYFPNPSSGFYFGVGVTGGRGYSLLSLKGFHMNLPLTIGNQFTKGKGYKFLQLQITPLLTTTLSYGIGF